MTTEITVAIAALLMLLGIWGLLTRRHLIKIVLGFSILDTGVHILMVGLGYRRGGTAPIVTDRVDQAAVASSAVDPVPSALVLTAIVIGLAVTALMLSYAVKMHRQKGSLMIDRNRELKW
jgi:multicomponent Na+:H+ antiporter subunit C